MGTQETGIPNLDACWWGDLRCYASTFRNLAEYCDKKRVAILYRESGEIEQAMKIERWCETVYNSLPKWARW